MDRFDRYYKSKKLHINEKLINTYIKYDDRTLLISNGYSVIYTKTIRNDFQENIVYKNYISKYYDTFRDKASECNKRNIALTELNGGLLDNQYKFSNDYSICYTQYKKIIDIIGVKEVNIIEDTTPVIEIIGRNNQVGYLLPCRVY